MTDKRNMPSQDDSLSDLIWAIEASEGQFSLIVAVCNYAELRERIIKWLHEECSVQIREVSLPPSATKLHHTVSVAIGDDVPDAIMVHGLESSTHLDKILTSANQVRDAFRKSFPFPFILWANDIVLHKLIRLAPDLESWVGASVRFEPSDDELLSALQWNANHLFNEILSPRASEIPEALETLTITDLSSHHEFEFFSKDIEDRKLDLGPKLRARLQFLQGRYARDNGQSDSAIKYYKASLSFWRQSSDYERQGVLQHYIARCYEKKDDLKKSKSIFYSLHCHF